MPNRLDLPPELASLIEKREQEDRRRQELSGEVEGSSAPAGGAVLPNERRTTSDRRAGDCTDGDASAGGSSASDA